MRWPGGAGLVIEAGTVPDPALSPVEVIADEAALLPEPGQTLRLEPLVEAGAEVAQGAPLARLRQAPQIALTAPMPGRVAALDLAPGRILSQIVLFHEPEAGRHEHVVAANAEGLRAALQGAGVWRLIRRRPFGGMPPPDERPVAIAVMAVDSRPGAPDPLLAISEAGEAFARGLTVLGSLTDGPVLVVLPVGAGIAGMPDLGGRLRRVIAAEGHPHGLAGMQVHTHHPASTTAPVWDIHAEDVAGIGSFVETGLVPAARLVAVGGDGLRAARLVRTQPGAHLGALSRHLLSPGAHRVFSGSFLEGREQAFLGPRDRQVTVLARPPTPAAPRRPHWFLTALGGASRPRPLIPTAALDRSLGGSLPAVPLLRAISAGDAEGAARLGALSLLPEDLALADYVAAAAPPFSAMFTSLLARMAEEAGPA
ncbi:Na(+)-translocating NADH-quinone reductase subunit A [Paracoccus sp. S-4012]|nr:Na(+)-translocating NADH-quinone reductase subunit A [Paracoccus sp. S-4012]